MTDRLNHFRPVYTYWRSLPRLRIWEIAFLMHDLEPRLRPDIAVQDPVNPQSPYGIELDISHEIRILTDAVCIGDLKGVSDRTSNDEEISISAESLLPWLVARGYGELAEQLVGYARSAVQNEVSGASTPRSRFAAQEQAILDEIKRQGFDPCSLPDRAPGDDGVKANVREALKSDPMFKHFATVFDKAWDRLRADQRIVGGK